MRRLEKAFGKPHPELEGYKPLHPDLVWLETSYLRLHRRRRMTEVGLDPLAFAEITHFADRVLELPRDLVSVFVQIIEATDQAVLEDYFKKRKEGT